MAESSQSTSPYRKTLTMAIGALLTEAGFDCVDKLAMETLIEMVQSFIMETGRSARAFSELTGRVEPLVGDIHLALLEMGFKVEGLPAYAKRNNRLLLPSLSSASQPKQPAILQAGQKLPHPNHIPDHLPPFPDPHAYIRTPTHKQPVTEYEALREKAAAQKRDVERALTRFVAKTGDTHSLFDSGDTNLFPLVACKPQPRPYLDALIPRDQIFDPEEEELDQLPPTPVRRAQHSRGTDSPTQDSTGLKQSPPSSPESPSDMLAKGGGGEEGMGGKGGEADAIDNPYLRPVKMPRRNKPK